MLTEWSGAAVEPGGGKPESEEWQRAQVPGRPASFAGEERVAYRTTVADPRGPDEAMALLSLDGVYDGGAVWLNDELVAEPDTYFQSVRVPFEPEDENEVVVECHAPDDRFGGIHDTDRVPITDAVPGIWWEADVTTHPESFVVDVDLEPRLTDEGAAIDAAIEVYAGDHLDDRLTLTTRPAGERRGRGMMDRAAVTAAPGERTTVEHSIGLRDPSLWWPRELGAQNRYEVRAKLDDAAASATTGIATVRESGNGLTVNGEPVPVRGVALQDATAADVDRAADVNANLVRAHAHVLPPAVYDACDEAGLLVWQDLPLTGPGLFDIARGRDLAERLAGRYRRHPSLAVFAAHDEPTETFADRLGSGFLDRLRFRWRAWRSEYDHGAAEEVADAFPEGRPVYPVVGEPGIDPDAAALYPGWDYGAVGDLEWLVERYDLGDVVGEFGAGALADGAAGGGVSAGTAGGSDGSESDGGVEPNHEDGTESDGEAESEGAIEIAGFDAAKHDAAVGSDDAADSQSYQASLLQRITGGLRTSGASVVVANALRDTDEAGTGVFDRDGAPKAGAQALAAAFEPVQAFLAEPSPGERDVFVVNGSADHVSATLAWATGDEVGETEVTVGATDRTIATTIEVPANAATVDLTLSLPDGAVEHAYSL